MNREAFSLSQSGINNLDQQFTVDRLEYYISEISVTHDSGQTTEFDSLWLLVDPTSSTTIDLSELSATNIESVSLHIGVSPDVNNLDPAEWPVSHPLAHKDPSMHWGWLAGYRFVAMEGNAGPEADYQIHALGNDNYFETTFTPNITVDGSHTSLSIFADYSKALKDIDLSDGVITHGEEAEAIVLLENFRDHVFTPEEPTDSIPEATDTTGNSTGLVNQMSMGSSIVVYPNPSSTGFVRVENHGQQSITQLKIFDTAGNQIAAPMSTLSKNIISVSDLEPGLYVIHFQTAEKLNITKRVVVLD